MAPSQKKIKAVGTRAEVKHGNALHTSGGLYAEDLFYDKYRNIKSVKASKTAKAKKNLGHYQIPKGAGQFIAGGIRK